MRFKILMPVLAFMLTPVVMQAQYDILSKIKPFGKLKAKLGPKANADYVFTSSPTNAGQLPKKQKNSFTTAEPVYAVLKFEKPLKEVFKQTVQKDGMSIVVELHAGNKKLGEAMTFFTEEEYYRVIADEKFIPLEIIPGEDTWQHNPAYVKLLKNIAELEPELITVKVKRLSGEGDNDTFTLDATNIAKDKERLLRIADRIRSNKEDFKETVRQHESKIWVLPPAAKRDAKLEGEMKSALKSIYGISASHIVLRETDWLVWKNQNTGIPETMEIGVTYAWKDKNGECWIHYDKAFRSYLGGGRYGNIKFYRQSSDHLVNCGNLK